MRSTWDALARHFGSSRRSTDDTLVEWRVRGIALTRENGLLIGSETSERCSAVIDIAAETTGPNGLHPEVRSPRPSTASCVDVPPAASAKGC